MISKCRLYVVFPAQSSGELRNLTETPGESVTEGRRLLENTCCCCFHRVGTCLPSALLHLVRTGRQMEFSWRPQSEGRDWDEQLCRRFRRWTQLRADRFQLVWLVLPEMRSILRCFPPRFHGVSSVTKGSSKSLHHESLLSQPGVLSPRPGLMEAVWYTLPHSSPPDLSTPKRHSFYWYIFLNVTASSWPCSLAPCIQNVFFC